MRRGKRREPLFVCFPFPSSPACLLFSLSQPPYNKTRPLRTREAIWQFSVKILRRLSVVRKPNTDRLYGVVSNFIACVTSGQASVEGAIKKRFLPFNRTASQLLLQNFNLLPLTNSPAATQCNKVRHASALQKDLNNLCMLIKEIANVIQCRQLYSAFNL